MVVALRPQDVVVRGWEGRNPLAISSVSSACSASAPPVGDDLRRCWNPEGCAQLRLDAARVGQIDHHIEYSRLASPTFWRRLQF